MKLYNSTKKAMVNSNVAIAGTWVSKSIGLAWKANQKALYFQTRWGIHTFGMCYPLTILICDDTFRVRMIKTKLLPWRIYFWNPLWKHIFELPYDNYPVTKGDIVRLIN